MEAVCRMAGAVGELRNLRCTVLGDMCRVSLRTGHLAEGSGKQHSGSAHCAKRGAVLKRWQSDGLQASSSSGVIKRMQGGPLLDCMARRT